MKFILCNTGADTLYGLDIKYFDVLKKLNIEYSIQGDKSLCIINVKLFEILLLRDCTKELIITSDKLGELEGNDVYPIIEIYDYWRE